MESGFTIEEIRSILPHRYPFLLVDRVLEWKPNEYIKAYKNVTINEPFFQGHYPDIPIMPGVLIMEGLAQCAGLLVIKTHNVKDTNHVFLFAGMDNVKFRKTVVPGDRLDMHCTLIRSRLLVWKIEGKAMVDGVLVAEGTISVSLSTKKES